MKEPNEEFLNFVVEKFKIYGIPEEIIRNSIKEGERQVLEMISATKKSKKQKKEDKSILENLKEEFKVEYNYKSYNQRKYFEELCSKKVY